MFTSQRIDLFECIYLPRANLIGIERLCSEESQPREQLARPTNPPEDEAFAQDEETLSHKKVETEDTRL